jgi:hypothetical protein
VTLEAEASQCEPERDLEYDVSTFPQGPWPRRGNVCVTARRQRAV